MREVGFVVVGVAVALVWIPIWFGLLHVFGMAPPKKKMEDCHTRRERLKRLGKLKYILTYGVLGPGLSFGLGMTAVDLGGNRFRGWPFEFFKFFFCTLCFGLFLGFSRWRRTFSDPVPFPPNYPPAK